VAAPSQRRILGVLFSVLSIGFAGVATAAAEAGVWVIGVAATVLAFWLATLALHALRAR
jgi:hypothetical protein